jgi:hypothetical protein
LDTGGKNLPRDKKHDPTKHNGRADEEHKAVNSVANHGPRRLALGDAEDDGREEGEEHNRSKVRGLEH